MPSGLRMQVEEHLLTCSECTEEYRMLKLADRVINQEKEVLSNPFLRTRIMAMIENRDILQEENSSFYHRTFKPAIIALTFTASVLTGVLLGNIYQPVGKRDIIPYELMIINDATIESVDLFLED
jgi:hypothetical protein